MTEYTKEEWLNELRKHFDENRLNMAFICPTYGKITKMSEFKEAGVQPNDAYSTCIGRHNGKGVSGMNIEKDEHRYLTEQHLGRQLKFNEIAHYKNGNKLDNRLENLGVMGKLSRPRLHNQKPLYKKQCAICGKEFVPNPTHRKLAKVCSDECKRKLYNENHFVSIVQLSLDGTVIKIWVVNARIL